MDIADNHGEFIMTLSVNVKKTTYLTFKPWPKQCNHNFSISLGDQLLTQTNADHNNVVYCKVPFLALHFSYST